jgi:hypothetical protein
MPSTERTNSTELPKQQSLPDTKIAAQLIKKIGYERLLDMLKANSQGVSERMVNALIAWKDGAGPEDDTTGFYLSCAIAEGALVQNAIKMYELALVAAVEKRSNDAKWLEQTTRNDVQQELAAMSRLFYKRFEQFLIVDNFDAAMTYCAGLEPEHAIAGDALALVQQRMLPAQLSKDQAADAIYAIHALLARRHPHIAWTLQDGRRLAVLAVQQPTDLWTSLTISKAMWPEEPFEHIFSIFMEMVRVATREGAEA